MSERLDLPPSDAFVIGAGPNGLSAAIVLRQAGLTVTLVESASEIGGSCHSAELTRPGFVHDVCAAVLPLAAASPFFRTLPLEEHGLAWIRSPACLAHPFDDGKAAVLWNSIDQTADRLGETGRYRPVFEKLRADGGDLFADLLAPIHWPKRPLTFARFGNWARRSGLGAGARLFRTRQGQSLFAGLAAHGMLPLEAPASSAAGLVLTLAAHVEGWPIPRGGAQRLSDALASYLLSIGGTIVTATEVRSLRQLPPSRLVLCDVTPRQFLRMAGDDLTPAYRASLERYRYGMAAFKIDWALHRPIPWRAPECSQAATVHLGGDWQEIADSERAAWDHRPTLRPFVLLAQPSLFDSSRAPAGLHTAWAYCHTSVDATEEVARHIEEQIERFAPGFSDCVVARSILGPRELERHNPNLVSGDIGGGVFDIRQGFLRPTRHLYRTSLPRVFLCSSSTPPGGGVHGMCGYHAARRALDAL